MDDTDELLGRPQSLQNFDAESLLRNFADKVTNDREANVGFQQRLLDQLQAVAHIRFRQLGLTGQGLKRSVQVLLERIKHTSE